MAHTHVMVGRRRSGGDWYESTLSKSHDKNELKALAKRLNAQNGPFEYKVKAKEIK